MNINHKNTNEKLPSLHESISNKFVDHINNSLDCLVINCDSHKKDFNSMKELNFFLFIYIIILFFKEKSQKIFIK